MTTTTTQTNAYDAGHERERLAHALAAWKTAGWADPTRAAWWYRRVRRLARACALPLSRIMADLDRDAQMILDDIEN